MALDYRLEIGGMLGRIIGVIKGAVGFAIGVGIIVITYWTDWGDGLGMWQLLLVTIVAVVFALFALYMVIVAVTKDDYEVTIGDSGL